MPKNGLEELSVRLDRQEAREAIADLIYDYARCMRERKPDEVRALFANDSVFELREGHPHEAVFSVRRSEKGVDAIVASLQVSGPQPVPVIHNLSIRINGDSARSNCVMAGQFYGASTRVFGVYDDTLRRIDGRWVFASRTFTIFASASSV